MMEEVFGILPKEMVYELSLKDYESIVYSTLKKEHQINQDELEIRYDTINHNPIFIILNDFKKSERYRNLQKKLNVYNETELREDLYYKIFNTYNVKDKLVYARFNPFRYEKIKLIVPMNNKNTKMKEIELEKSDKIKKINMQIDILNKKKIDLIQLEN